MEKGISNAQNIPDDPEQDRPARRSLPAVGRRLVDGFVALSDPQEQPASGRGQRRHARQCGQGTHAGPGQSAGHASAAHLHADPRIRPGVIALLVVPATVAASGQPDSPATAPGTQHPASPSLDRQARPARALCHFRTRWTRRCRRRLRRPGGLGQQRNRSLCALLGAEQTRRAAGGHR
ncbi:hypothetical protein D9M73_189130 [compost metagenome]